MILELEQSEHHRFDSFICRFENSLLFHSTKYLNYVSKHISADNRYIVNVNSSGDVLAGISICEKTGEFGVVANSSAYYGSNGGILFTNPQAAVELAKYLKERLTNHGAYTFIESPYLNQGFYNESEFDYTTSRITHINHLGRIKSEDDLFAGYHFKTRNVVRKALKSGFELAENSENIAELYRIHVENMLAIGGKAKTEVFFTGLPNVFAPGKEYKIFYAVKDGETAAAVLLFYFNNTVEYYTPVINQKFRNLQPLSFLIHNCMLLSAKAGFKYWNWGGSWSSQEALVRFKERWGGEVMSYRYFTKINNQDILKASPKLLDHNYSGFFVAPYEALTRLHS